MGLESGLHALVRRALHDRLVNAARGRDRRPWEVGHRHRLHLSTLGLAPARDRRRPKWLAERMDVYAAGECAPGDGDGRRRVCLLSPHLDQGEWGLALLRREERVLRKMRLFNLMG